MSTNSGRITRCITRSTSTARAASSILARDGEPDDNLVWKDTVLIPAGQTVDILLDVTNPGRWMAHCHIAEHIESGMMFSFDVLPAGTAADRRPDRPAPGAQASTFPMNRAVTAQKGT